MNSIYLLFMVVGFLIALVVAILLGIYVAGKKKKAKWKGGVIGALVVIVPIFWDWPLTVIAHKYYCEKEAGFWVYKTLEQWKAENPGVMEALVDYDRNKHPDFSDWPEEIWNGQKVESLNKRFILININHLKTHDENEIFVNVWRWKTDLIDKKNGEVIASIVDFSTGNGYKGGAFGSVKFWLQTQSCQKMIESGDISKNFINDFKGDVK